MICQINGSHSPDERLSLSFLFPISLEGPEDGEIGVLCIGEAAASASVVRPSQPTAALAERACHHVTAVH